TIVDLRADLHVQALQSPADRVDGDIIPGVSPDDPVLVAQHLIAVIEIPDFNGKRIFQVGIRVTGESNATVALEVFSQFEHARRVISINPQIELVIVSVLKLNMPGEVAF